MKNILIVLGLLAFIALGIIFSLIALYASPDGKVHFSEASYFWIGNAIAILGLLYYYKK